MKSLFALCDLVKEYEMEDPSFVNKYLISIYGDNVAFGGDSTNKVFELYLKAKSRLRGHFNLTRFAGEDRKQIGLREKMLSGLHSISNSFVTTVNSGGAKSALYLLGLC